MSASDAMRRRRGSTCSRAWAIEALVDLVLVVPGRKRNSHWNVQWRARMLSAVPPSIDRRLASSCKAGRSGRRGRRAGASLRRGRRDSMMSSAATITALTPLSVWLECASRPVTVVRNERMPLCALTTFMSVGSPMMASFGLRQVARRSRRSSGARRGSRSPRRRRARCGSAS